jgi:hypothetical protein
MAIGTTVAQLLDQRRGVEPRYYGEETEAGLRARFGDPRVVSDPSVVVPRVNRSRELFENQVARALRIKEPAKRTMVLRYLAKTYGVSFDQLKGWITGATSGEKLSRSLPAKGTREYYMQNYGQPFDPFGSEEAGLYEDEEMGGEYSPPRPIYKRK